MSIFPADVANSNTTPVTDMLVRQQVEDLLIDYSHALDDFELDRWPNFFTEDGIYQIIPRESYDQNLPLGILFCDGRGMMVDRILALETANIFEPHTNNHILDGHNCPRTMMAPLMPDQTLTLHEPCKTAAWRFTPLGNTWIGLRWRATNQSFRTAGLS